MNERLIDTKIAARFSELILTFKFEKTYRKLIGSNPVHDLNSFMVDRIGISSQGQKIANGLISFND